MSAETRAKQSIAKKGKLKSAETRRKMSLHQKGKPKMYMRGEKNTNWKGGVSKVNKTERRYLMQTLEYKIWRRSVFERDNYTCIWCGKRGGNLHADHIKPWAFFPELRFAIDNGRTLCVDCHRKTDTYSRHTLTVSSGACTP